MLLHTHILFSLFIALLIYFLLGLPISILALVFCIIGGLFPDIDEQKSKAGRAFPVISWLSKHRGLFHSLLVAGLIFAVLYYLFSIPRIFFENSRISNLFEILKIIHLAAWFFIGYLSHLVLDSFNPTGVAWLAPLIKKRVRGEAKTGSLSEKILDIGLVVGIVLLSSWIIF